MNRNFGCEALNSAWIWRKILRGSGEEAVSNSARFLLSVLRKEGKRMPSGILEVLLIDARGLRDTDFLGKMDPYVVIQYKTQERKSSVASGNSPVWNEKFVFRVQYPGADDQYKLFLRIMDKDRFSKDDFVGEATIYVKDLMALGLENGYAELHPSQYRVIFEDGSYCGQIQVGITFTPKIEEEKEAEDLGGWKYSSE